MMLNRKNTGRRAQLVPLVAITAAAAMALTACGGGSGTTGETSATVEEQKITFIPKQLNNPYTDVVLGGGKDGSQEAGFASSQVVGPLEASASSQVSFINAETQAGTNVIVIAANDPDAVCTAWARPAQRVPRSLRLTPTPTRTAVTCSSARWWPRKWH